jgi:alpha-1,2-mannosyltransferase
VRNARYWAGLGAVAFAVSLGLWLYFVHGHAGPDWSTPVDLQVYRDGGLVVAHVRPFSHARLYDFSGPYGLPFTYSPFAALVFALAALASLNVLVSIVIVANIAALAAALWVTFGALGYRGAVRAGATLLAAAVALWAEPVQRTLFLGQIELLLMALILADLSGPGRRRWQGAGVGLAAGIKLVPLIFIPYLLLARRFRQAAVAAGTFAATVALGFALLPADSRQFWLEGTFDNGSRTGFIGFGGNQSLRAILTRLAGSVAAAEPAWLLLAAVTVLVGLGCAAALDRAGERLLGVLTCALTGLLVSPISWDHHWVWIVPGLALLAAYGARASGPARWAYWALAVAVAGAFGAWPVSLWGEPDSRAAFTLGFIWAPPESPSTSVYSWTGWQLVVGNLYVLIGVLLLALLCGRALGGWRSPQDRATASAKTSMAATSSTPGAR